MNNRFNKLGIGLCITGAIIVPVSYFGIGSVPLTSIGISAVLIGMTCILLAHSSSILSPEVHQLMLKTGLENTAALLEVLGVSNKAIYLPSTMRGGDRRTVLPLEENTDINSMIDILSNRLLIKYGQNPEDMAISLTTPGCIDMEMFETIPGPSAEEIETAINFVLVEILDIADSASVILFADRIYIAVSNPKMVFEDILYYRCMGSPIASIIATISSEALGRPIRIIDENPEKKLNTITLEVLP